MPYRNSYAVPFPLVATLVAEPERWLCAEDVAELCDKPYYHLRRLYELGFVVRERRRVCSGRGGPRFFYRLNSGGAYDLRSAVGQLGISCL